MSPRDLGRGTTELRPMRGRELDFRFAGDLLGILGVKECVFCNEGGFPGEEDDDLRGE